MKVMGNSHATKPRVINTDKAPAYKVIKRMIKHMLGFFSFKTANWSAGRR